MNSSETRYRHKITGTIVTNCYYRENEARTYSMNSFFYLGVAGQWIGADIINSGGQDWERLNPIAWRKQDGSYTHIAPSPLVSEDEFLPIWTVENLIERMTEDGDTLPDYGVQKRAHPNL